MEIVWRFIEPDEQPYLDMTDLAEAFFILSAGLADRVSNRSSFNVRHSSHDGVCMRKVGWNRSCTHRL